jgi:hypothetical protein
MQNYELQKATNGVDGYGNPVITWSKVADIQVSINIGHDIVTNNDISYKVQTPSGITTYKGFTAGDKYRLNGPRIYEVVSVYTAGRWTQLQLKVVS